jgi:ElaB/YqjD/DUF883 family membrane-anchored ribosome-binding protein
VFTNPVSLEFSMAQTAKVKSPAKPATKPVGKAKATSKPKAAPQKLAKAAASAGTTQSKVKDDMNNFKDKAADTARNAAERGKDRASEAVGSLGKLLRDSAATIDENVGATYGDYARSAADSVEGFADKMSAKPVDAIVDDARQFVRKSPAVAIGAAAAIGFVLARLIRSGRDT